MKRFVRDWTSQPQEGVLGFVARHIYILIITYSLATLQAWDVNLSRNVQDFLSEYVSVYMRPK